MPQLGIRTPLARVAATSARTHPKAYLSTVSGLKVTIPIAPADVDHGGYSASYDTLDRAGRKPLVVRTAPGLRSQSFELFVASEVLGRSVQYVLDQIAKIAAENSRVTFSYGRSERGLWRITSCGVTVTERAPYTNDATKAIVRLSLLEAVDAVVNVGPLTGGAVKPPPLDVRQKVLTHTVKRGDSPQSIALRYYGVVSAWPLLLRANKITDPRTLIVGRRITIVPLAGTTAAPVRPGGVDLRKVSADVRRILIAAGWLGTQLDGTDHVIYPPHGISGVLRSRIVKADAAHLIRAGFTRRAGDKVDTLYPPASIRAT